MANELDADLENDILEWSEEFNVQNDALVVLFGILKGKGFKIPQSSLEEPNNLSDTVITSQSPAPPTPVILDNAKIVEYLENLKTTQNDILKAVEEMKNQQNDNKIKTQTLKKLNIEEKLPFKNVLEFFNFEENCKENYCIEKDLNDLIAYNGHHLRWEEFLNFNLNKFFTDKTAKSLSRKMSSEFIETNFILKILNDVTISRFPNIAQKSIVEEIVSWFKTDETVLINPKKVLPDTKCDINDEQEDEDDCFYEIDFLSFLPCKTIEDLKKFEDQTKEIHDIERSLISMIQSGEEDNIKDFIYSAMEKVFDKSIVDEIVYVNICGSKTEIKDFKITEIIIDCAIEKFNLDLYTNDDAIIFIQNWIQTFQTDNERRCLKLENDDDEMEFVDFYSSDMQDANTDEFYKYQEEFLDDEDIIINIPCKTENEYEKFEEVCKSDLITRNKLKQIFLTTNNSNHMKFIRYNFEQMLLDDAVADMNWSGYLDEKNVRNFVTIKTLEESTIESFPSMKANRMIDYIQLVFQQAKQRAQRKKKLVKIKSELDETQLEEVAEIKDLNDLPCIAISQFIKFNLRLDNDELLKIGLRHLLSTNSRKEDLRKYVEESFKKIMIDEVAGCLSWKMSSNVISNLLPIDDFFTMEIFYDCLTEIYPHLSTSRIDEEIRQFLSRTRGRIRKRTFKRNLDEVKNLQKQIPIKREFTGIADSHSMNLQSAMNLPFNSLNDLKEFDLKCKYDTSLSENLITLLLQGNENDCKKFVDKNLRKLITENVGSHLTWMGVQDNTAAKDFHIMKILIDCTKKQFTDVDAEAIIENIKLALRRFKDRIRKRKTNSTSNTFEQLEDDETHFVTVLEEISNQENNLGNDDVVLESFFLRKLPCSTVEDFQTFEKLCRKSIVLQNKLKTMFDSNPNNLEPIKFVSENLKRLVSDSVLGNFSYKGLKSNICIKNYTIVKLLMASMIGKNPYLSEDDAISTFKKAIIMAKDRERAMFKKKRRLDGEIIDETTNSS